MKKIITIAILFFSYLSFAQNGAVETSSAEKLEILPVVTNSLKEDNKVFEENSNSLQKNNKGNESCRNFYKKKNNIIIGNPLNSIKLTLPNSFNWLHHSIVNIEKRKTQFMTSTEQYS